jgi:hypothetical protein
MMSLSGFLMIDEERRSRKAWLATQLKKARSALRGHHPWEVNCTKRAEDELRASMMEAAGKVERFKSTIAHWGPATIRKRTMILACGRIELARRMGDDKGF